MTTSANDRHRLHQWALRLLARETKRARHAMCTSSTMQVPVAPCAQMHYLVAVLPQLKDAVCKAVCKAPVSLQSAHLWQNSYCCPRVRLLAATNATICPRVALWHSLAAPSLATRHAVLGICGSHNGLAAHPSRNRLLDSWLERARARQKSER